MKPHEFISRLDETKIVDAIAAIERKSSGEIRVFISHDKVGAPLPEAARQFAKFGMDKTRERNAVLIFVAPVSHQFAVVGDVAVHQKCGDAFWQEVSGAMSDLMKQGRFTEAILAALGKIGDLLAKHFPRDPDDTNELPNEILRG
jgi:uncharacterized membrane protein